MLEGIRHFTGNSLIHLGLKESVRRIYFSHARSYLSQHQDKLSGAWARRSLVNSDFVPVMSDVDLTVLISLENLKSLYQNPLRKTLLVRDIQIVAEEFLSPWLQTGGFRNRQIPNWVPLLPSSRTLIDSPPEAEDEIAFELSQEAYLLYWQIEQFQKTSSITPMEQKLWRELERLAVFWRTRDPEIWTASRSLFDPPFQKGRSGLLAALDVFAGELLGSIASPMNSFDIAPLRKSGDENGHEAFLSIRGKPVYILTNVQAMDKVKGSFFIITENFLKLIKGIGIQEQSLLNLAAKAPGYYREFNRQRLAHDLIQALILEPWNKSQIYFCFKNIEEYLSILGASETEFRNLPEGETELLDLSHKVLARLGSLS